jgi:hypothetical protein
MRAVLAIRLRLRDRCLLFDQRVPDGQAAAIPGQIATGGPRFLFTPPILPMLLGRLPQTDSSAIA